MKKKYFIHIFLTAILCYAFVIINQPDTIVFAAELKESILTTASNLKGRAKSLLDKGLDIIFETPDGSIANQSFESDNYIMLVNYENPVERDYVPDSMTDIADSVKSSKSELYLDEKAAEAYISMAGAAEEDGITDMCAVSGYRSYNYQSNIYAAKVREMRTYYGKEEAEEEAAKIVARPGTSEHQLGLAVDVSSPEIGYGLTSDFENTKEYKWLKENAYKYGYILRYPSDKTDITSIIYEPWHIRYVGCTLAEKIFNSGLCLEEYAEQAREYTNHS